MYIYFLQKSDVFELNCKCAPTKDLTTIKTNSYSFYFIFSKNCKLIVFKQM